VDWLAEFIVRMILEAVTGRPANKPPAIPPLRPPPLPPSAIPGQNPNFQRPPQRRADPGGPGPQIMPPRPNVPNKFQLRQKISRRTAARPGPRSPVQPPTPIAPPAPAARVVEVEAPPPTAHKVQPPTITGSAIHELIQSRPVALRTIFTLSEVIRPPLALRGGDPR
jgi:hypothetical protein